MLFRRKKARFEYDPDAAAIRLKAGCAAAIDRVEINANGDIIYYRGANRTHFLTFEIADYDGHSDSRVHGLPSADRLRGCDKASLAALARITGVPVDELQEARDLETSAGVPPPTWK